MFGKDKIIKEKNNDSVEVKEEMISKLSDDVYNKFINHIESRFTQIK